MIKLVYTGVQIMLLHETCQLQKYIIRFQILSHNITCIIYIDERVHISVMEKKYICR